MVAPPPDPKARVETLLEGVATHAAEGRTQEALEAAMAAADEATRTLRPGDARIARAIRAAALLNAELGNVAVARDQLNAIAAQYAEDDPRGGIVLADLANLALSDDDNDRARELFAEAIERIDHGEDEAGMAVVPLLGMLALLEARRGEEGRKRARRLSDRALDIAIHELGEFAIDTADCFLLGALFELLDGDPKGGRALARRAYKIYAADESPADRRAVALQFVAIGSERMGDEAEAATARAEAKKLGTDAAPTLDAELERLRKTVLKSALRRPARRR